MNVWRPEPNPTPGALDRSAARRPIALLGAVLLVLFIAPLDAQAQRKGKAKSPQPAAANNLAAPQPQSVTRPLTATVGYSCPFCDLRGADMAGRNLTDANLQGANLEGANLKGANLSGTVLAGANLANANLEGARLNRSGKARTDLAGANLVGALLQGASIDGTDLQYVDLSRTNLNGVDLRQALASPRPGISGDAPWVCGNADLSKLSTRIYVATSGTDNATCGSASGSPCATIARGIARCGGTQACGVLVGWGTYKPSATIALADGVNVYGGCTPATAQAGGLQSLVEAPGGGQPAMSATGIKSATILQGFRLQGSAAQARGAASVTLTVANSSTLSVIDTRILAQSGGIGADGATGGAGAAGVNGSGATAGTQAACSWTKGGNGSVVMGVYLTGNEGSFRCNPTCSDWGCWGYPGSVSGGKWGDGNCAWCSQSRGATGQGGGDSPDGSSCGGKGNASGVTAGTFSGTTWTASTGGTGGTGAAGGGGGGGGAGGYRAGYCFGQRTWEGNQGGGGGAGGCAGGGGVGGQQGGASLAVTLFGSSLTLTNSAVVGGFGGAGGKGGTGGQGGARSSGAGGLGDRGGGYGGKGGNGGAGAAAGGGAGGNGGPAVGVALVSNSKVTDSGTVYYTGASGTVGGFGTGGAPIVAGLCSGTNGDQGKPGAAVDKQTY